MESSKSVSALSLFVDQIVSRAQDNREFIPDLRESTKKTVYKVAYDECMTNLKSLEGDRLSDMLSLINWFKNKLIKQVKEGGFWSPKAFATLIRNRMDKYALEDELTDL